MENPMIAPEDAASAAASEAPAAAHKPGRIHFIDEVRGIDIVLCSVSRLLYDRLAVPGGMGPHAVSLF